MDKDAPTRPAMRTPGVVSTWSDHDSRLALLTSSLQRSWAHTNFYGVHAYMILTRKKLSDTSTSFWLKCLEGAQQNGTPVKLPTRLRHLCCDRWMATYPSILQTQTATFLIWLFPEFVYEKCIIRSCTTEKLECLIFYLFAHQDFHCWCAVVVHGAAPWNGTDNSRVHTLHIMHMYEGWVPGIKQEACVSHGQKCPQRNLHAAVLLTSIWLPP